MPCLHQPYAALVVQVYRMGPELPTNSGSRCYHVQLRKDLKTGKNEIAVFSDTAGKLAQNPHHLPVDFTIGDLDRIIQIDQLTRLEKHRGAAGRNIVDNTGDTPLHIDLDREDIPAFALRKVALLKHFLVVL